MNGGDIGFDSRIPWAELLKLLLGVRSRNYTSDLESFPGMVFVQVGALDDAKGFGPQLEMFTKPRLDWAKPLDLSQFTDMRTERWNGSGLRLVPG